MPLTNYAKTRWYIFVAAYILDDLFDYAYVACLWKIYTGNYYFSNCDKQLQTDVYLVSFRQHIMIL